MKSSQVLEYPREGNSTLELVSGEEWIGIEWCLPILDWLHTINLYQLFVHVNEVLQPGKV